MLEIRSLTSLMISVGAEQFRLVFPPYICVLQARAGWPAFGEGSGSHGSDDSARSVQAVVETLEMISGTSISL